MFYALFNFSPLPSQRSQSHPRKPAYSLTLSRRSWVGCNTWPCFPGGSESTMVVLKIPSQSTRLYTPLQLLCRTHLLLGGEAATAGAAPALHLQRGAGQVSPVCAGLDVVAGLGERPPLPSLSCKKKFHPLTSSLLAHLGGQEASSEAAAGCQEAGPGPGRKEPRHPATQKDPDPPPTPWHTRADL